MHEYQIINCEKHQRHKMCKKYINGSNRYETGKRVNLLTILIFIISFSTLFHKYMSKTQISFIAMWTRKIWRNMLT